MTIVGTDVPVEFDGETLGTVDARRAADGDVPAGVA